MLIMFKARKSEFTFQTLYKIFTNKKITRKNFSNNQNFKEC